MHGELDDLAGRNADPASVEDASIHRPTWPERVRWAGWAAAAAALCVLIWMGTTSPPSLNRPKPIAVVDIARQPAMLAPRISGRLGDGRAYQVTATRATVNPGDDQIMHLEDIRGHIALLDGAQADIQANTARYDRAREHLALAGDVVLTRTDGYRIETAAAELWRTPSGLAAKSDRETRISGPTGDAEASGVTVAPGFDTVRLIGPVSIRLNAGASQ